MEEVHESEVSPLQLHIVKGPLHFVTEWGATYESELGNVDVKATPLFELASVRVITNTFKEHDAESKLPHLEVYGHVLLIDDFGNQFYLFNRNRDDAKTVFLHRTSDTSVILQSLGLGIRCMPSKFWLLFKLIDRHRDIVIIDDCMFIDCTREVAYDKKQFIISGEEQPFGPFVFVDYTIFQCALLACVGVIVEKIVEDGSDAVCAQVSGTISATYKLSDMSCIKHVLFDKSEKLDFGTVTLLSTWAVPAYSLLEIQANVEVNGEKIVSGDGALKFDPIDWACIAFEKEIVGKKCRIRVFVIWQHPRKFLPEYDLRERRVAERECREKIEDYFSESEDISDRRKKQSSIQKPHKKRPRITKQKKDQSIYIRPRLQALSKIEWIVSKHPEQLVEVFSISVCSYDAGGLPLSLNGKIYSHDGDGVYVIFDGTKKTDMLHSHETVKLVHPGRCYVCPNFGIELELKDGEGREISFGHAAYDFAAVRGNHNTRICSVIPGKHGFASLHYTIFRDAVQAKLKFTVESNFGPVGSGQVYGSIKARYSNFRYSTDYEKKYYQSILFRKGELEEVVVDLVGGGEIPLSKSVVAVPLNASLIVVADITLLLEGKKRYVETLKYKGTFSPEKSFKPKFFSDKFQGSDICLSVFVEWSSYFGIHRLDSLFKK